MPIDYSVDREHDLLVCIASGTVTNQAILSLARGLVDSPTYRTGMNGLVDLRPIEDLVVDADAIGDVVELATRMEHRFEGSRWAVIADRDALFGLTRWYELRREAQAYDVKGFRDAPEAYAWLGLPEDYDPPAVQELGS